MRAIIPAWNAAETIGRAIESILAQSYTNVEVIVVNDGSPDNTADVVAEQYPQVRLLDQENSGPCVARNHGAFESSGELIAFLDSDDEWTTDKLEKQVGAMAAHPEIDMLGTNGWRTVGEMRYLAGAEARAHADRGNLQRATPNGELGGHQARGVRGARRVRH